MLKICEFANKDLSIESRTVDGAKVPLKFEISLMAKSKIEYII